MELFTYDVNSKNKLYIGRQYDHKALTVTFSGFTKDASEDTVYLQMNEPVNAMIPLTDDYQLVIQSYMTQEVCSIRSQLCDYRIKEGTEDTMEFVKHSPVFYCKVAASITEQTEVTDPTLDLVYAQMHQAYLKLVEHEETASASASAAKASENNAKTSETNAANSETAAKTAQGKAETAQSKAEKAESDAEAVLAEVKTAGSEALSNIGAKQTEAVNAVKTAQATATDAIASAQNTAVSAVGSKQTEAVNTVEAKKTEAVNTITPLVTRAEAAATTATTKASEASSSASAAASDKSTCDADVTKCQELVDTVDRATVDETTSYVIGG